MIEYLAKKITNYYIKKNTINEDEREVYEYCFDVAISTLLNLFAILILSFATRLYIEGIAFCIVFMVLRGVGGGYHAKTHFMCFMTIMIVFAGYVVILKLLIYQILFYLSIYFFVVGVILILILAPVDNENKPLSKEEFRKNKMKTILVLSVFSLVTIILFIFNSTQYYSFCLSYPIFMVANLMILGSIKNIK